MARKNVLTVANEDVIHAFMKWRGYYIHLIYDAFREYSQLHSWECEDIFHQIIADETPKILENYDPEKSALGTYVYGRAQSAIERQLREWLRVYTRERGDEDLELWMDRDGEDFLQREDKRLAAWVLHNSHSRHRKMLKLYLDGKSSEEIAKKLGVSRATVYNRLQIFAREAQEILRTKKLPDDWTPDGMKLCQDKKRPMGPSQKKKQKNS